MKSHSTLISLSQIKQLRSTMLAMPRKEKTEFNIREAVKSLEAEINSLMLERGYSLVDIAKMFNEIHVPVTANTISAYLRELASAANSNKKGAPSGKKAFTSRKVAPSDVVVSAIAVPQAPMVTIGENTASFALTTEEHAIGDQAAAASVLNLKRGTALFEKDAEAAVQTASVGQVINQPHPALLNSAEKDESRSYLDLLREDEVPSLSFGAK